MASRSKKPAIKQARAVLRIRASALAVMREHARRATPEECCGALFGKTREEVVRATPVPNEAAWPSARYTIGADGVRKLERAAAGQGLQVVGFYHSHPGHDAEPTEADIEAAWPWYVYLINGSDGTRAWRLREDRSGFDEIELRTGAA